MDCIPTDVLGVIILHYLRAQDEILDKKLLENEKGIDKEAVRLGELRRRVACAFMVCSTWKALLQDEHAVHDGGIYTHLSLKEASKLFELDGFSSQCIDRVIFSRVSGVIICSTSNMEPWTYWDDYPLIENTLRIFIPRFCPQLNYLCLEMPDSCRTLSEFDCSLLTDYTNLDSLVLKKFKNYSRLEELPISLKKLQIEYGEIWERDVLTSHSASIFSLGPHVMLEEVYIEKTGVLGIISRQAMDQIQKLTVNAMYILIGVTIDDEELVELFQKPYKEGAYVPPHILGDWNAVETSHRATDTTCTLMLQNLSQSKALKALVFAGEGAQSLKIIPALFGNEGLTLQWISGVTEQSSSLLYGMSGEELKDRLHVLQMMKGMESTKALEIVTPQDSHQHTFTFTIDSYPIRAD